MQLAIKKAKEIGIGMVCARRSNHYGIAGFYSLQAVEQGLIVSFKENIWFKTLIMFLLI